ADTEASRSWLDEQQSQLRDGLRLLDAEHAPGALAVDLRDPASLALGIKVRDELRDDIGHQRLEPFVPAVLIRVERAVALDDPTHIPWAMRAQRYLRGRVPTCLEHSLDPAHRCHQTVLLGAWDVSEHGGDLIARFRF